MANVFDRILDLLASLVAIIIVIITLVVCVNVMLKYFLNRPILGVEEITEHLLLFITFFGSAWLLRKEGHVTVDFVLAMANPKTRAFLGFITSLFGIAICLPLVWYGSKVTWLNFLKGHYFPTLLEIPKAPILAIIPFGSLLLLIQFIRRSAQNYRNFKFPAKAHPSKHGN
jgi:TRAP-type C4-dicarboxylate transport system permease small subunit